MRKWPVNFGSSHWLGFYRYDFKYELLILHAPWAGNMPAGHVKDRILAGLGWHLACAKAQLFEAGHFDWLYLVIPK